MLPWEVTGKAGETHNRYTNPAQYKGARTMNDSQPESHQEERRQLTSLLASIRRKIFAQDLFDFGIKTATLVFPISAVAIAINQFQGSEFSSAWIIVACLAGTAAITLFRALANMKAHFTAALALDEKAKLQDRVTSALQFLAKSTGHSVPEKLQIADAVEQAQQINAAQLFRLCLPAHGRWFALGTMLLIASLFAPSLLTVETVEASIDQTKQLQLEELKALEEELAAEDDEDPELQATLEKLRELQKDFEQGELTDRDLMIELARLDEELRQKTEQLGVQHLEGELNVVVPHLMGSASTQQVATAIQEKNLEKAVEELEKLSEQARKEGLSDEEKKQLAMNFGAAAAKLGKPSSNSFSGEFSSASEALESSDTEGFCSACKSMGDKLKKVNKARKMAMACNKLGQCKACIGQCNSNIGGYLLSPKSKSNKKGGLRAGNGSSDDPLNDPSRLEEGYRQLLQVAGQAGDGPVETETEITEGQLSPSQLAMKDIHAEFAAVAEEAIESETIPLSHRFHVKRYFQTIRPKE